MSIAMTLQLKKYLFNPGGALVFLVLLLITESSSAQKKNCKIKPDHLKIQYAGGTGFLTIGAGYANRNKKLEVDLYYGYLPESTGGVSIHSLSGKFIWLPISPIRGKKLRLEPLTTGLVVNYSFGKQYFGFDPPNYPYRYYSFPTAIHSAILIGSRFGFESPPSFMNRLLFYYELLSFDRDIISFLSNPKSLDLPDVITLSLGMRIDLH
jgi:hypothetical protein